MTTDEKLASILAVITLASGCGKKLDPAVSTVVEAQRGAALKVAEEAAKLCPRVKLAAPFQPNPMAAPPPPPSPAKGTALEPEAKVVDVFVTCSWPDPRDPTTMAGTSLPSLRGTTHVPAQHVTMPDDMTENTCAKDAHDCVQVITPSRYGTNPRSADLRIVRPAPDSGEVEVRVVFAIP
jgi:hypothetical protein